MEYLLEETTIELVWLDMKSAKNDFPIVIPIQQEIIEGAEAMGRKLEIFSGLPTHVQENQLWGRSPVLIQ